MFVFFWLLIFLLLVCLSEDLFFVFVVVLSLVCNLLWFIDFFFSLLLIFIFGLLVCVFGNLVFLFSVFVTDECGRDFEIFFFLLVLGNCWFSFFV